MPNLRPGLHRRLWHTRCWPWPAGLRNLSNPWRLGDLINVDLEGLGTLGSLGAASLW